MADFRIQLYSHLAESGFLGTLQFQSDVVPQPGDVIAVPANPERGVFAGNYRVKERLFTVGKTKDEIPVSLIIVAVLD